MKMNILIITLLIFCSVSCEKFADHSYTIEIKNNSNQIIDVYAAYILPDTLLPLVKPILIEIQPSKSGELYDRDVKDQKFIKFKTEKLSIFVLSKDTISKYSWEVIITNYNILKRYEITEKDLTVMGGSVAFP
jgi:hypothetical protein